MGQRFLIDTNVIIDGFGNQLPPNAKTFISQLKPIISIITKIEVLGWRNATQQQLAPLYQFMDISEILQLSEEVIEQTIELRQQYKIGLGDAIIGATALHHNLVLVTRNETDLEKIKNLRTINPYKL